jgi:hypothetical protein
MDIARTKAEFCIRVGVAPSEYDQMTMREIIAFTEVHNESQERR